MSTIFDNTSKTFNQIEDIISKLNQIREKIKCNSELATLIEKQKSKRSSIAYDNNWDEILNYVILRLAYDQLVTPNNNKQGKLNIGNLPLILLRQNASKTTTIFEKYIIEYFAMRTKPQALPKILQQEEDKSPNFKFELITKIHNFIMKVDRESPVLNSEYEEKFPEVAMYIIYHFDALFLYTSANIFVQQLTTDEKELKKALTFYCFAFLQSEVISQPKIWQR